MVNETKLYLKEDLCKQIIILKAGSIWMNPLLSASVLKIDFSIVLCLCSQLHLALIISWPDFSFFFCWSVFLSSHTFWIFQRLTWMCKTQSTLYVGSLCSWIQMILYLLVDYHLCCFPSTSLLWSGLSFTLCLVMEIQIFGDRKPVIFADLGTSCGFLRWVYHNVGSVILMIFC